MGRAYSTNGTDEKFIQIFGRKAVRKDTTLRAWRSTDWIEYVSVGWIQLAQDRDRLQALVKTVIKLLVPLNFIKSLVI